MQPDQAERFLAEAVELGRLTPAQAEDCRRVADVLDGVHVRLGVAAVAVRKGYLTRESAEDLERRLARRQVGKYEILDKLGEGGAGIVWRARDTTLDRVVAMKLLSRASSDTELFRARFLREARIAVTLNHVNIVRGIDFGEASGYRFFVMEFVAGESLARRIAREGRLDEGEAVRIVRDVVRALTHVRRFDLVHRDVKPGNILVTPRGQVKVCDLGLAKPTPDEASCFGGGVTAGTPLYMSPEQIRLPETVDWRSDVYSLGATLYHAVCGSPPFVNDSLGTVVHKHLETPPPNPRGVVESLSQGVAAVIAKMLEKDPAARYASLDDLAADLDAVAGRRPPIHAVTFLARDSSAALAAGGSSPGAGVVRRRRPLPRWATAAGWVLGAAVLAGSGFEVFRERPPPLEAREPPSRRLTRPPSPGRGPEVPDRIGTRPEPEPRAPSEAQQADARHALRSADELLAAHDIADPTVEALIAARAQFRFVLDRFPGTAAAVSAQARLDDVADRLALAADDELHRRLVEAAAARASGSLARACRVFVEFPAELGGTTASAEAERMATELEEQCRRVVAASLGRARTALEDNRFAVAELELLRARGAALPDQQGAVAELERSKWSQIAELLTRRDALRDEYRRWSGRVVLAAGHEGMAAARDLVASEAFDAFGAEVANLRSDLDVLEAWRRSPGTDPAAEDFALGFDLVSRGRFVEALEQADLLPSSGADESRLRRYVSHARSALHDEVVELVARAQLERKTSVFRARESLTRALDLLPSDPLPLLALGHLELFRKQWRKAREAFSNEAVRHLPEARLELARLDTRQGDFAAALGRLQAALEGVTDEDPVRRQLRDMRSVVLARQIAEARKALRRASKDDIPQACRVVLGLDPDDEDALARLGLHLEGNLESEDWEGVFEAWRLLHRYLAVRDRSRIGRKAQVARALARIGRRGRSGASVTGLLDQARRMIDGGRPARARDLFAEALSRRPFEVAAHFGFAESMSALGSDPYRLERARAAFGRVLLLDPDHGGALTGRASSRLELGDLRGALADATRAKQIDPLPPGPWLLCGRAHLGLGQQEQAIDNLAEAHRRAPSAVTLYLQAVGYARVGRNQAARNLLGDLEEFPVSPALARSIEELRREHGLDEIR